MAPPAAKARIHLERTATLIVFGCLGDGDYSPRVRWDLRLVSDFLILFSPYREQVQIPEEHVGHEFPRLVPHVWSAHAVNQFRQPTQLWRIVLAQDHGLRASADF